MKRIYVVGVFISKNLNDVENLTSFLHIDEDLIYEQTIYWNCQVIWQELSVITNKDRFHNDPEYDTWLKRHWRKDEVV